MILKYVTSLIIDGKFDEAEQYILFIKENLIQMYLYLIFLNLFLFKNKEYQKALKQIKKVKSQDRLFIELKNTLVFWMELEQNKKLKKYLVKNFKSTNSPGITLINKFLASKYIDDVELYRSYNLKILNSDSYVRYKVLSAWNLSNEGKKIKR